MQYYCIFMHLCMQMSLIVGMAVEVAMRLRQTSLFAEEVGVN